MGGRRYVSGGGKRDEPGIAVLRDGRLESFHRVRAAVVRADGGLVGWVGDPGAPVFARSVVKPVQALPLLEDGVVNALGLRAEHVALACASHGGEPAHVTGVREMLALVGAQEEELACGPQEPLSRQAARELLRAGGEPGRLHNNCSGKHAGMLALADHHGWARQGYHRDGHPVQERMERTIALWSRVPVGEIPTATDGCGVRTFGLPLGAVAEAFARLGKAAREGGPAGEVVDAMRAHPFLVGGSGRLCTRVMEVTDGEVVVKVGAEGLYGAWLEGPGVGVAVKVEDGARRAADPALLGVLRWMGVEPRGLEAFAYPVVRNSRGEAVGRLEPAFGLETG